MTDEWHPFFCFTFDSSFLYVNCFFLLSLFFVSLFEKSPQSKVLFGFPVEIDPTSKDLLQSKRFKMHAVYMIQMLDTALELLGPDIEMLTDILLDLGVKHRRYGVKPEMFGIMGKALIAMLEKILGPKGSFNDAVREAWIETYGEISNDMIMVHKTA